MKHIQDFNNFENDSNISEGLKREPRYNEARIKKVTGDAFIAFNNEIIKQLPDLADINMGAEKEQTYKYLLQYVKSWSETINHPNRFK